MPLTLAWLGYLIQHSILKVHYLMGCFWILFRLNNVGKGWKYSGMLYAAPFDPFARSGHLGSFLFRTLRMMVLWRLSCNSCPTTARLLSDIWLEVEVLKTDAAWSERPALLGNMGLGRCSLAWLGCAGEFPLFATSQNFWNLSLHLLGIPSSVGDEVCFHCFPNVIFSLLGKKK